MIGIVLLLGLLAMPGQATSTLEEEPLLTIDPCVEADERVVRELVELEIRDSRARRAPLPKAVSVRCDGEDQEIRVEPWISDNESVRVVRLPTAAEVTPALRQARSRELALAIAELLRRVAVGPPAPPEPPPPSAVATTIVPPPLQARERPPRPWRLGLMPTFEAFSGGHKLAGGDLLLGSRLGPWFLLDLRAGGRWATDVVLSDGRLQARAMTVGAALGPTLWSSSGLMGGAFMLCGQEYLVWFRTATDRASARTAFLGAFALAGEPRLMLALSRHFSLEAAAALGYAIHGIAVRMQGNETTSMSGLVVSANLAGVLTF